MPVPKTEVIVLGLSPTGLYAVREAGRAGHPVFGIGAPGAPGLWSRFLTEKAVAQDPVARVKAILDRYAPTPGPKPVLIVTSDQDLDAVFARAEELDSRVHLQESYKNGLATQLMDKGSFHQLCHSHDVGCPRVWTAPVSQLKLWRDKISYPCIIKPARIQNVKHLMQGRKAWVVQSPHDFDTILPKIPVEAETLVMQEIVHGPESNIMLWCGYTDRSGVVRQRFTARKLRQFPAGFGSASLVQSEWDEEVAATAETLLTQIRYHGIAAAEFKRCSVSGALKIIEINTRPSLWFSLSTAANVPLIETFVADMIDAPVPDTMLQRNGIRWRYTLKDLATKLFYLTNPNFILPRPNWDASRPAKARTNAVAAWDDPLPACGEIVTFVRKGFARMRFGK